MTMEEAQVVNDAITDPVPRMGDVPNNSVQLMRGIHDLANDVWHDVATVRELTGEDEEHLSSVEKKKGLLYSEYMSELLARAVLKIGDVEVKGSTELIDKLPLGDRDILYLAIVRATYGDTREIQATCTSCGETNDVVLELDVDFPIIEPTFDLKQGMEVTISEGVVRLRLPNGEDTRVVQKESDNEAHMNTLMLSRCVLWDTETTPQQAIDWARRLKVGDRKKLVNALLTSEFGPTMREVNTQCASCEQDMPLLLDWVSLLLG